MKAFGLKGGTYSIQLPHNIAQCGKVDIREQRCLSILGFIIRIAHIGHFVACQHKTIGYSRLTRLFEQSLSELVRVEQWRLQIAQESFHQRAHVDDGIVVGNVTLSLVNVLDFCSIETRRVAFFSEDSVDFETKLADHVEGVHNEFGHFFETYSCPASADVHVQRDVCGADLENGENHEKVVIITEFSVEIRNLYWETLIFQNFSLFTSPNVYRYLLDGCPPCETTPPAVEPFRYTELEVTTRKSFNSIDSRSACNEFDRNWMEIARNRGKKRKSRGIEKNVGFSAFSHINYNEIQDFSRFSEKK